MFCVVPTIISGHIFNQAPHSHPFLGASPCDPTFTKERQAGLHQYKLVGQDQGPNLWSKNKLNIRRWKYVQQQSQQICPNKIYMPSTHVQNGSDVLQPKRETKIINE
jgi:uncharacterized GH25 family protein